MTHSVLLVQRGITAITHPVTGKGGKLYGQATQSPEHGGVAFSMPMADYMDHAHDLIGNATQGQQWVPLFIVSAALAPHKCDRCMKPAVAVWQQFHYCEEHAPGNATYIDGSNETVDQRKGKSQPPREPEITSGIVEPISKPVVDPNKDIELPVEHMAAPTIGTNREELPPGQQTVAHVAPVKTDPMPDKPAAPQAPQAPQAPDLDKAKNVVAAITEGVIAAIMPKIDSIVDAKVAGLRQSATKKAKKSLPRPETDFTRLQKRAKELNINSFGKKAEQLKAEIAAAEKA